MTERDEELELEALQRQLDDAFETTRPGRGFQDELWLRMQQRRPLGTRIRDALTGMLAGLREAPAIPLGALALVLIVAIGVGVYGSGAFQGGHNTYSSGLAPVPNGAAGSRSDYYTGGQVPTPALHPGRVDTATGVIAGPATASPPPAGLYYGPANLQWTGSFASAGVSAPVLVYAEPTSDQMRSAEASFGALQSVTVQVRGTVPQLPREPVFIVGELAGGQATGMDPVVAANAFLADHNLLPSWPYTVAVTQAGPVTGVVFEREFTLPDGSAAPLIDWTGARYGTEVDIVDGTRTAVGPLPTALQSVTLPLISNSQAVQLALSEPPASTQLLSPVPTVNLDRVELVYALAVSGKSGFYEPAYLFSGTFSYNGQTYVKRVLVPLVVPSLRS